MHRTLLVAVSILSISTAACDGKVESSLASKPDGKSTGGDGPGTCLALPTCDDGDAEYATQKEACNDGQSCYTRSACGSAIWCAPTLSHCAAAPVCPAGFTQVTACAPDANCTQPSICGSTITCQEDTPPCAPPPACDDGDTQVPSESDCLQDEARCYSRTGGCDDPTVIWCTG